MKALLAAVLVFVALAPGVPWLRARGRDGSAPRLHSVGATRWLEAWRRRWRQREQADAVPQALELVARSLRSGASVLTAIDSAAAEVPDAALGPVVSRVRGGLSLDGALDGWAQGESDRQTAAALLALGHSSGAAMAASLDRAAASLRQRQALGEEIRALTSQTRASAVIVGAAPAGFAVLVALIDSDALTVMLTTGVGLVSLALGLVLEGLGLWWMGRLCRDVVGWA